MRVMFVDVGGLRARCLYEGAGYPLLLIHGVGLSADIWLRNIDTLARDFHVCAPDLPGHGFTHALDYGDDPPHPHLVEHLARLVDKLGIDRFAVAGSSFGGLLSGLLYFRMPERIEKLIIIGSGAAFNTEEEWRRVVAQVKKNGLAAVADPTLEGCRARMANICFDAQMVPEEILHLQLTSYAMTEVTTGYRRTIEGMADIEATRPYRIRERLEEISVPTQIIWGRDDTRGIFERAVEAANRLPRSDLVVFERCGHLPFLEYPDQFNKCVRDFLLPVAAMQMESRHA